MRVVCSLIRLRSAGRCLFGRTTQHRQRCLHAVREIGEAVANALLTPSVLLDQRVEVVAQAIEFTGDRPSTIAASPASIRCTAALMSCSGASPQRAARTCATSSSNAPAQPAPQCAETRQLGIQGARVMATERVVDRFAAVVLPRDPWVNIASSAVMWKRVSRVWHPRPAVQGVRAWNRIASGRSRCRRGFRRYRPESGWLKPGAASDDGRRMRRARLPGRRSAGCRRAPATAHGPRFRRCCGMHGRAPHRPGRGTRPGSADC